MSEFVPVAREDEIPGGEVKVVHAGDKSLALGHCEGGGRRTDCLEHLHGLFEPQSP